MTRSATKKMHPLAELALGALERTGNKMFRDFVNGGVPGVVDGVLEDVEHVAAEVTKRTKTARGKIAERKRRR